MTEIVVLKTAHRFAIIVIGEDIHHIIAINVQTLIPVILVSPLLALLILQIPNAPITPQLHLRSPLTLVILIWETKKGLPSSGTGRGPYKYTS